ncbi:DNA replication terminus site-binding protein [Salinispirillum sp. LH 10-3-1]|uniref:DNA replication terminus site-binding protein n=1 Tax=Salinispirillum sp. LH 10-3-1 TaxID=2952525 RepID=A0AB38YJU3_9GAMM
MPRELTYLFDDWLVVTQQLNLRIRSEVPQSWMWGTNHLNETIKRLCYALSDIWYLDGQDGRATRNHIGVVKVTPSTLELVQRTNDLRQRFHLHLLNLKKQQPGLWPETSARLAKRAQAVQGSLEREGLVRLHLKQFSRTVPILHTLPTRIAFNWYSSGRSIKRLSKAEVLQKLEKLGADKTHIRIQYQKVAQLPDAEALAQVQTQAPLIRANVRYETGEREAFNVAMPIFIPTEGGHAFPDIIAPPDAPPTERSRATRSDQKLEDHPFVPSLRVYRYR